MRWPKREPRASRLSRWHKHFCVLPAVVDKEVVWLETVDRRLTYRYDHLGKCYVTAEYREQSDGQ